MLRKVKLKNRKRKKKPRCVFSFKTFIIVIILIVNVLKLWKKNSQKEGDCSVEVSKCRFFIKFLQLLKQPGQLTCCFCICAGSKVESQGVLTEESGENADIHEQVAEVEKKCWWNCWNWNWNQRWFKRGERYWSNKWRYQLAGPSSSGLFTWCFLLILCLSIRQSWSTDGNTASVHPCCGSLKPSLALLLNYLP